jgi:hypothetical protein
VKPAVKAETKERNTRLIKRVKEIGFIQTAEEFGLVPEYVRQIVRQADRKLYRSLKKKEGLPGRGRPLHSLTGSMQRERDKQILIQAQTQTLQQIANRHKISRQRVSQILQRERKYAQLAPTPVLPKTTNVSSSLKQVRKKLYVAKTHGLSFEISPAKTLKDHWTAFLNGEVVSWGVSPQAALDSALESLKQTEVTGTTPATSPETPDTCSVSLGVPVRKPGRLKKKKTKEAKIRRAVLKHLQAHPGKLIARRVYEHLDSINLGGQYARLVFSKMRKEGIIARNSGYKYSVV